MHIIDMFKSECVGKSEHGALKYSFVSRQIMPRANMCSKRKNSVLKEWHTPTT
jgi:hypothetical protein